MTKEEAIKDIQDNILPVVGGKSLVMAISALRQPNIIRCKDCKHYSKHKEDYMCGLNVLAYVCEADYCSRAERRE